MLGQAAADRRAAKPARQLTDAKDIMKGPKIGKLVTVKRNPFYDVMIKSFEIQMKLNMAGRGHTVGCKGGSGG